MVQVEFGWGKWGRAFDGSRACAAARLDSAAQESGQQGFGPTGGSMNKEGKGEGGKGGKRQVGEWRAWFGAGEGWL